MAKRRNGVFRVALRRLANELQTLMQGGCDLDAAIGVDAQHLRGVELSGQFAPVFGAGNENGFGQGIGQRAALRTCGDENGHRLEDWPARDARGPWGPATDVVSVTPVAEPLIVKVACRNPRNGERTWIDLDWWICEPVYQDGALW